MLINSSHKPIFVSTYLNIGMWKFPNFMFPNSFPNFLLKLVIRHYYFNFWFYTSMCLILEFSDPEKNWFYALTLSRTHCLQKWIPKDNYLALWYITRSHFWNMIYIYTFLVTKIIEHGKSSVFGASAVIVKLQVCFPLKIFFFVASADNLNCPWWGILV